MKDTTIRFLLTLSYSFPFVYFAMYLDFFFQSINGWLIMVIALAILLFVSTKQLAILPLITGTLFSTFLSIILNHSMENKEQWSWYFKPLEPSWLIIIIMLLCLIVQLLVYSIKERPLAN